MLCNVLSFAESKAAAFVQLMTEVWVIRLAFLSYSCMPTLPLEDITHMLRCRVAKKYRMEPERESCPVTLKPCSEMCVKMTTKKSSFPVKVSFGQFF